MPTITASSVSFSSTPRPGTITRSWKDPANHGTFSAQYDLSTAMEAIGSVTFADAKGSPAGWSIGFMQAISLVDWAIYRAPTAAGGSVLVRNGCLATGPNPACWDAQRPGLRYQRAIGAQTPLVGRAGSLPCAQRLPVKPTFPLTLEVALQDEPEWFHAYIQLNSGTKVVNTLYEARAEVTLCAVLAATDPAGAVHLLQNFTWVVHWHNLFTFDMAKKVITNQPTGRGNFCTVGPVTPGAPTDPRFAKAFTAPHRGTCNTTLNRAAAKTREEKAGWAEFNVPR